MIEAESRIRKWGNSIGIVIPKDKIKKGNLHIDQKVRVLISPLKTLKVKDIFGKLKDWKKPTEKIMKELDEELDSKFLR